MQPNELRIGNWIRLKNAGGYSPYAKLCSTGNNIIHVEVDTEAVKGTYTSTEFANLEPIPLTTELLENIGFKHGEYPIEGREVYFKSYNEGVKVVVEPASDPYYKTDIGKPLVYLHQLQNLYFALTGEELPISTLNLKGSVATDGAM
jgi:hypothetical protein